jgi:hypothetical protein
MTRKAGVVVLAALVVGCGKAPPPQIVEVEGVVRLDGKPLKRAEVRFIPVVDYGPEYLATGVTDDEGRFRLTCNGRPGACAGENQVLVMESELPNELKSETAQAELARYLQKLGGRPLPQRYANLAESPLTANVTVDRKDYSFNLNR